MFVAMWTQSPNLHVVTKISLGDSLLVLSSGGDATDGWEETFGIATQMRMKGAEWLFVLPPPSCIHTNPRDFRLM